MKILISAIGSTGDTLPLIQLASALTRAGHTVLFAAHEEFSGTILSEGLEFIRMPAAPSNILSRTEGSTWMHSGTSSLNFVRGLKNLIGDIIEETGNTLLEYARDTDMLIYSTLSVMAPDIAEYFKIKSIGVFYQPLFSTDNFPAMLMPDPSPLQLPFYNKLSFKTAEYMFNSIFADSLNKWRMHALKKKPRGFLYDYSIHSLKRDIRFFPVSEYLLPKPGDWPHTVIQTGYWYDDDNETDPVLDDFIESGSKPYYIGFGSMTPRDGEEIIKVLNEIARTYNERFVLCRGWTDYNAPRNSNIYTADFVNHNVYLSRMKGIIHHCGSGTAGAALRSGVPSVPVPFFADQFFWAKQLRRINTASHLLPISQFSVKNLLRAFDEIERPDVRRSAVEISGKVIAQKGIEKAVRIIDNL
ncbi:MAG: glycosyltransferase [bacterium]